MRAEAEPVPQAAAVVFGDRLPVVQAYAEMLATVGVERGLLGPRERPRLWERHLLNCAGLVELLEPGETVIDLGSGAGLPGVVLAAARPDLHVVLVEPLLRRATFLTEALAILELPQVTLRRSRAEDLTDELMVDAVVARAVAPLERLAGWALPLLRPGGRLLALKGERAQTEMTAAQPELAGLGGVDPQLVTVGARQHSTWSRVVIVRRGTLVSTGVGPSDRIAGKNRRRPARAGEVAASLPGSPVGRRR